MPLFRKPDPAKAPAAAEIYFFAGSDFMPGEATVVWHGDPELLVHGHAIYLDWVVNKDLRSKAVPFLEATRGFFEAPRERTVDYAANPHTALYALLPRLAKDEGHAVAAVTITFSAAMRCSCAFDPRRSLTTFLYPTFWALWNESVIQLGVARNAWETVEALVENMLLQLDYYDERGMGAFRGGIAPILAGFGGASSRLRAEVAEAAGLSPEEFAALPEAERDRIIEEHGNNGST